MLKLQLMLTNRPSCHITHTHTRYITFLPAVTLTRKLNTVIRIIVEARFFLILICSLGIFTFSQYRRSYAMNSKIYVRFVCEYVGFYVPWDQKLFFFKCLSNVYRLMYGVVLHNITSEPIFIKLDLVIYRYIFLFSF